MTDLLDPKNDIVFKAILVPECNEDVLISLISAVTCPSKKIVSAKVQNPELPKKKITDRGVILDILTRLDDGSFANIEMQMNWNSLLSERSHFYAAKLFASQLHRGANYSKLKPTTSIYLLGDIAFKESHPNVFHYTFRMREDQDRANLGSFMVMHFIEIPKLFGKVRDDMDGARNLPLKDWCLFLYNPSDPVLQKEVFDRMPALKKAHDTLKEISTKEELRELARMREKARLDHESFVEAAFMEGEAKGRAEGEAKGREEGRAEGEAKGRMEAQLELKQKLVHSLITNPATKHLDIKKLAALTELSVSDVKKLIKSNS